MNIIFFLPALLTLPLELVWNLPFMFFQQILMYAFVGGIYAFLYYEDTLYTNKVTHNLLTLLKFSIKYNLKIYL